MSKLEYDPNELFEAGGIFLLFDVPKNTEFGIDYNCWRTGENFKGKITFFEEFFIKI